MQLTDHVVVVLVEPQHPGNVGAAARAMKNMGLHRLTLVAPPAYDPETARWMGPGCDDVLSAAQIVATLDEALHGVHRAIATTARHRRLGQPVLEPRDVAIVAHDEALAGRTTALLFGREDFGLSATDVARCESLLRIPTPEHASLNLAQAVLLVSHALFEEGRSRGGTATGRMLGGSHGTRSTASKDRGDRRDRAADLPAIEPAARELVDVLERVGYLRGVPREKVRLTARQALQRAAISVRHVEALRGMVRRVDWALDHPGIDWQRTSRDDVDG